MANTNSTYIGKNAGFLTNPTSATLFQQLTSPIATVASTQIAKPVYIRYAGYAQSGAGASNNINVIRVVARASGRMTFGAAATFTPSIVIAAAGTSVPPLNTTSTTTLGSLTGLAASGAGVGSWAADLSLLWEPNSGVIGGTLSGFETTLVSGTAAQGLTAAASITPATGYTITPPLATLPTTAVQNSPTSLYAGEGQIFLAVAGVFSASNANHVATLDDFEFEVL